MLNFPFRESQPACSLCGGWAPKKHFLSMGEGGAQPPAPQVAVPIPAKGEFPPDVSPVEPVRQLHKLDLTLQVPTGELIVYFLNGFILGRVS